MLHGIGPILIQIPGIGAALAIESHWYCLGIQERPLAQLDNDETEDWLPDYLDPKILKSTGKVDEIFPGLFIKHKLFI